MTPTPTSSSTKAWLIGLGLCGAVLIALVVIAALAGGKGDQATKTNTVASTTSTVRTTTSSTTTSTERPTSTTTTSPPVTTAAPPPSNLPDITMAEFEQLKPGMSYQRAADIIGGPGELISQTDMLGTTTVMYMWEGTSLGGNANAMFQNNKLVSKAQFGLV